MRRIYSVGNQSALFTKLPGPAGAGARSQAVARDPQSAAGRTSESEPPWTHARPKVGLKVVRLGLGPVEMYIDCPLQPPRPDPILFIMDRKDNLLARGCELGGDKLRRVVHSTRPMHDQCTVVIR